MAGKRKSNPGGSSNPLRADVLRVLGVLKVATAEQIQRVCSPHLSFRHTGKATEAKRKEARTAAHRGALADLRGHGLTLDGGRTRAGEVLRSLTPLGLEAASYELGRPMDEMGGTARGAGRSGAPHPMAVNETVLALIRPKPDLALLNGEPAEAIAAAEAAVAAPAGIGTITSYATEVPLPSTGTWANPGKGGVQADIVLTAPEAGVPLLFIEVDNCFEDAARIAAKFDKYMRFYRRRVKDTDGRETAMWRTRWSAPADRYGDAVHPPVLLVFNKLGPRNPDTTAQQLADLTRQHWQGQAHRDHHTYDGKIPIVVTGLQLLREHGPAGPAFLRLGRGRMQPLLEAIGNPRQEAADARYRAEEEAKAAAYLAEKQREAEQKEREREARRPVCRGCGKKFTDERWRSVEEAARWHGEQSHSQLCENCQAQALEADRLQAEAAEEEQRNAAVGEAARKPRGFLSRIRS